jgi:three-Cys-motif partner protein
MALHEFGGDWTEQKLERLRKYLPAFLDVMHRNSTARAYFQTIYIDAFAGTGYRSEKRTRQESPTVQEAGFFNEKAPSDEALGAPDAARFREGSAIIALDQEPPFDRYVFIDTKIAHVRDLQKLQLKYFNAPRNVDIKHGDANTELVALCRSIDWVKWRGVVFLDPYGMSVDWSTIEALSKARIDLWLLFPIGQAVNRVLTRQDLPPPAWESKLNRFFGTTDWQDAFYRSQDELDRSSGQMSLWNLEGGDAPPANTEAKIKVANFASIERFFVQRLRDLFQAVPDPLTLHNSQNVPLYLLCFASHNAGPALNIAKHVLKP